MHMRYPLYACLIVLLLADACTDSTKEVTHVFSKTGWSYSCPYLTRDASGQIILTWAAEDSTGRFSQVWLARIQADSPFRVIAVQAISHTEGVHPHGENLPKLACTPDGYWMLVFGTAAHRSRNPYAGELRYVISSDGGYHWSTDYPLVSDRSSHDQRYAALWPLAVHRVMIIWMDDRLKTQPEGSTLFLGNFNLANRRIEEKPVAYNLCPCCRTAIMIDSNHVVHLAFRKIFPDSVRDIVHMASVDTGKTFTTVRVSPDHWKIDACPHSGPSLTMNRYGLQVVWYTLAQGQGIFYTYSADEGLHFAPRQQVSGFNASAKHGQIASLPNGQLIIAWDEYPLHDVTAHQRIGLQLRKANGMWLRTWYIHDSLANDQFPVLLPLNNHQVMLAYTRQRGHMSDVVCRIVNLP
ncbi:MAG: hypothetical protein K6T34_02575 [Thermoflavifilum sp.]|nr:hypothetical protein [Thermoflavifilum sp.]